MGERRMLTAKVTDADAFVSMPSSAQALYLHLNMGADDDGFNNQVQLAMFKAHASVDDVTLLLAKRFILQFESGVIVIKHWRMANALRNDRYKPTNYQDELQQLQIKENKAYTFKDGEWLPNGCQMVATTKLNLTEHNITEEKKGKKKRKERFTPPTVEEVQAYCDQRKNGIDAEHFVSYYASQQWKKANGLPLEDWKMAVITWEKKDYNRPKQSNIVIPMPEYEPHESKPATAETLEMVRKMQEEMK